MQRKRYDTRSKAGPSEESYLRYDEDLEEHAYNPIGTVHGGYAATLLDFACGCAVDSRLTASQAYSTLELKVADHKAITKDTGLLRAESGLLSFGQRVAFAEARLTDAHGKLYALPRIVQLFGSMFRPFLPTVCGPQASLLVELLTEGS
jgi:uncharacterized protein (TIGR00369 family)